MKYWHLCPPWTYFGAALKLIFCSTYNETLAFSLSDSDCCGACRCLRWGTWKDPIQLPRKRISAYKFPSGVFLVVCGTAARSFWTVIHASDNRWQAGWLAGWLGWLAGWLGPWAHGSHGAHGPGPMAPWVPLWPMGPWGPNPHLINRSW